MTDAAFESDAYAAFLAVLGEPGLDAFRELVAAVGPGWATLEASNVLKLTENDRAIFGAVARRLDRELQEQPEEQPA